MRDIAELKLFFNELGDPGNVARLAREQVSQHQQRIAMYEEMHAHLGELPAVARRMETLRLGLEMEHTFLRFWRSLANSKDGSDKASCRNGPARTGPGRGKGPARRNGPARTGPAAGRNRLGRGRGRRYRVRPGGRRGGGAAGRDGQFFLATPPMRP